MSGSGRINVRLILRIIQRMDSYPDATLAEHLRALGCSRATLYRQIIAAREELGVDIEYTQSGGGAIRSWGILNPAAVASRR
ncbi:hypothetical protein JN531_012340 [Flagellatimonas centrodinii]|uniref:hypothetical protein n=1 Tax=Flagellatimonas centrodinii TaxID=2806210 RepID=UPI001FEDEF27|nr:hypothetical protein [Flagellatimonas centrodinii]ULQ45889.1 hypothetical protein JN531_012340 [Flagellatimonas centrodinii]